MRVAAALLLVAAAAPPQSTPRLYIVDAAPSPGGTGSGLWRPTGVEADAALVALRDYIHSSAPAKLHRWHDEKEKIVASFETYVIQAEGVRAPGPREFYGTEGNGPKQIRLDGFCDGIAKEIGPRIAYVPYAELISDGGYCIFHATYDVSSRQIVDFRVNGVG